MPAPRTNSAPRTKANPQPETPSVDVTPYQNQIHALQQQLQQASAELQATQAHAYRKQMAMEQAMEQKDQLLNQIAQVVGFQGRTPGELIAHLQSQFP